MTKEKKDIKRLSIEFTKHINQDGAKVGILAPKILLETLCLWPDSTSLKILFANYFVFFNLFVIECFHTYYAVLYYAENAVSSMTTLITVTTTLESLVRIYCLMFKKDIINDILYKIWKNFWAVNVANPRTQIEIKRKVFTSAILPGTFFFFAVLCNLEITGTPFIKQHSLILNSEYPYISWNQTYVYESLYIWQYFFDWYVLFTVSSFDLLFLPLVMICAMQFRVIQDVFQNIFTESSERQKKLIFERENISDKELVLKCLEQHELLLKLCTNLENSFNIVILIQYVTSTMSICSSALVLRLDRSQFSKMMTYSVAHLTQLFCYCFVGQELTHQSTLLSDKIFSCNWCSDFDRDFRRTMIMMIQRCHRECVLTAAGITNLDFAGLIKVLRISFSFYTLFDSLMTRRGL
ncbi:odorant receptor 85c-like [Onthophagus taurus]|uniref:odorant receptor 85c-like n=1 Tax=Onthophagus taurus TaxID=166361 RepID=UPI0039BECA61